MNRPVRTETLGTRSLIERAAASLDSARSLIRRLKNELPPEETEMIKATGIAKKKLKKAGAALERLQRAWDGRVEPTDS